MDFKLPNDWKQVFEPEPQPDLERIIAAFRSIPKKDLDAFWDKFRLYQLKGIFSSSEDRSAEALAIAKSTKQIQSFISQILVDK